MISKISIGTAQFGLDYGISNQIGKVSFSDAENIIELAYAKGIDKLDTASAYGKSEKVLGKIGVKNFKVTSKIPTIPSETKNINDFIIRKTESSLEDLKIDKFNCILVHDCYQFFQKEYHDEFLKTLLDLKRSNLTSRIGLSVYNPFDESIIEVINHIDVIQSSFNIFDQRLNQKDLADSFKSNNVQAQARSIFLQGLLLMNLKTIPKKFKEWKNLFNEYHSWLDKNHYSALSACLNFAVNSENINEVILGIDAPEQLMEIVDSLSNEIIDIPKNLECNDDMLINPSYWDKIK
jgi:aryl-alcohol dehydrogenase-like predicted oxidoreductase|tara:strand:- start:24683 stop:25561 length:879 start_codon:yes stop_codon:yes gene_type:complete